VRPVFVLTCAVYAFWLFTNTLAKIVSPEFVGTAAFCRLSTDAVAKVLAPSEIIRALFWLASASAFLVVEDLVVTTNLRSANATIYSDIVVLHHVCAWIWFGNVLTCNSIPDLMITSG